MRTDQYIGLTSEAQKFVKKLIRLGTYEEEGAFYNRISYGIWKGTLEDSMGHPGNDFVCVEVCQAQPWSSGPMYYTHLKIIYTNGSTEDKYRWSETDIYDRI